MTVKITKKEPVLITGSSRGLGRVLARVFAKHGHPIVLNGRSQANLRRVRREVLDMGVRCYAVHGDIADARIQRKIITEAKRRGVAIFINNAARLTGKMPFENFSDAEVRKLCAVNFSAPIALTHGVYRAFVKKKSGTIITINSVAGLHPRERRTLYCAAKWGLRGFTDTLRLEAAERGIFVLDVYPDRIKTRPEFTHGMDPLEVAEKVYRAYAKRKSTLVLSDRSIRS